MIAFALNQMVAPKMPVKDFIDMAARLGCVGVELRNDLKSKNVSSVDFLDGFAPSLIGQYARDKNIRILGLSEVYSFNYWTDEIHDQVQTLIDCAIRSEAESVSLIPDNSGAIDDTDQRMAQLIHALEETKTLLSGTNVVALIEPLGFSTASLRYKSEAIDAIKAVQGERYFKIAHDSFHHFLADEKATYPDHTGIVHISGITDTALQPDEMADEHRILVNDCDRLGNIEQIQELAQNGYRGAFSFEPFSSLVHETADIESALAASMEYIRAKL